MISLQLHDVYALSTCMTEIGLYDQVHNILGLYKNDQHQNIKLLIFCSMNNNNIILTYQDPLILYVRDKAVRLIKAKYLSH